jgi:hypothetical protein
MVDHGFPATVLREIWLTIGLIVCADAATAGTIPAGSRTVRECLPAQPNSSEDLKDLEAAVEMLRRTPDFGGYLSNLIEDNAVTICWDPMSIQARGYFDPELNLVAIASGVDQAEKTVILAHELRHLDQRNRGYKLDLDYDAIEHIRQTYAIEADAEAFAILVAWENRYVGDPSPWNAALGSSHYSDIAVAFEEGRWGELSTTSAMKHLFIVWYQSDWRRVQYYYSAYGNYLDVLDSQHGIRMYRSFPEDHFDNLCILPPDNSNYGCHFTDEIGVRPTIPH